MSIVWKDKDEHDAHDLQVLAVLIYMARTMVLGFILSAMAHLPLNG